MRLTQNDYFCIYEKFGYIIDVLYNSNGALYLKDLRKYTHKSYSQTCKDVILLENLDLIKADIIDNSKIISLKRKIYRNLYNKDIKKVSRDKEKLKENNLKAYIYHNFDISRNEEIKKYLYSNHFDLNSISKSFKKQNEYIFNIFNNDIIKFYDRNKNKYKVVIRAYQIDYKRTKEIIHALESIYNLFFILELDSLFKCDVTIVTNFETSEYSKKYLLKKLLNHKTKTNYTNSNKNFSKILYSNFQNKIILLNIQDLNTNNSIISIL